MSAADLNIIQQDLTHNPLPVASSTYRKCCVHQCGSSRYKAAHTYVSFFKFPKKKELRKRWITNITQLNEQSMVDTDVDYLHICSKHFTAENIGRVRLKPFAVPTIFPHSHPDDWYALNQTFIKKPIQLEFVAVDSSVPPLQCCRFCLRQTGNMWRIPLDKLPNTEVPALFKTVTAIKLDLAAGYSELLCSGCDDRMRQVASIRADFVRIALQWQQILDGGGQVLLAAKDGLEQTMVEWEDEEFLSEQLDASDGIEETMVEREDEELTQEIGSGQRLATKDGFEGTMVAREDEEFLSEQLAANDGIEETMLGREYEELTQEILSGQQIKIDWMEETQQEGEDTELTREILSGQLIKIDWMEETQPEREDKELTREILSNQLVTNVGTEEATAERQLEEFLSEQLVTNDGIVETTAERELKDQTVYEIVSSSPELIESPPPPVNAGPRVCPICGITGLKWMVRHIQNHSRPRNMHCSLCPRTFYESHVRDSHERTHTGERPFECPDCDHVFISKAALKVHRQSPRCAAYRGNAVSGAHHKEQYVPYSVPASGLDGPAELLVCDICGVKEATKRKMLGHMRLRHMTWSRGICPVCGKSGIRCMPQHMRCHRDASSVRFPCAYCPKTSSTAYNQRAHHMTHTGERPFVCADCGRGYRLPGSLRTHRQMKHRSGGRSAAAMDQYQQHQHLIGADLWAQAQPNADGRYACPLCDLRTYRDRAAFMSHLESMHAIRRIREKADIERPFVCADCGRAYSLACSLRTHRLLKHRMIDVVDDNKDAKEQQQQLTCSDLWAQVQSTEDGRFMCPLCDRRTYVNRSTLMMHLEITHGLRRKQTVLIDATS